MRRIFIFGSLLLLVAAVQVAAQSDVIDVSTTAASWLRSHTVQAANLCGPGVTHSTIPDLRVGHLAERGHTLQPLKASPANLLCVLRC
jgi:hypothetical protein